MSNEGRVSCLRGGGRGIVVAYWQNENVFGNQPSLRQSHVGLCRETEIHGGRRQK